MKILLRSTTPAYACRHNREWYAAVGFSFMDLLGDILPLIHLKGWMPGEAMNLH
jgi:hypothetical protein